MNMDRETYVREVSRIIRENFRPNDVNGSMTAAKAGSLVRQVLQTGPTEHGFSKFKDVLLELERQGEIGIGFNSKNALAICLPQASTGVDPQREQVTTLPPGKPFRPFRNRLWLAFVAQTPVGRRFMNKRTREVLLGQDSRPQPEDDWIEIVKVPDSEEKADAREFIETEGLQNDQQLMASLDSDYWYSEFPAKLRSLRSNLVAKWNRRRSVRIFERAEEWRVRHGIPPEMLYQSIRPPQRRLPGVATGAQSDLRDALLAALQTMETAELLELRIPARCLLIALRPDLNPDA